jgi:hypothetical protein
VASRPGHAVADAAGLAQTAGQARGAQHAGEPGSGLGCGRGCLGHTGRLTHAPAHHAGGPAEAAKQAADELVVIGGVQPVGHLFLEGVPHGHVVGLAFPGSVQAVAQVAAVLCGVVETFVAQGIERIEVVAAVGVEARGLAGRRREPVGGSGVVHQIAVKGRVHPRLHLAGLARRRLACRERTLGRRRGCLNAVLSRVRQHLHKHMHANADAVLRPPKRASATSSIRA